MEKVLALLVPRATEYVDNTLATASWWDKYILDAGLYRFVPVGYRDEAVREGERPEYLRVRISAELVEEYRVNRLLWASSEQRTAKSQQTMVTLRPYPFMVKPGDEWWDGAAVVVEVQECPECKATPEQECLVENCQGRWIGVAQ